MRQAQWRPNIKKIAMVWGMACITLFMLYPARDSILHGTSLENIASFPAKIVDIQPSAYISRLLISCIEMGIFCLIYIMAGILPVLQVTAKDRSESSSPSMPMTVILGSSFLVGHWLLSTFFFIIAYFYVLTPSNVLWISTLIALPGLIPIVKRLRESFINIMNESDQKSPSINMGSFYWVSIFLLFTSLLLSSSRLSYDSIALYFSDAKITALTQRLMFFQGNYFFVSEMQTGIQFSAIMQVFGEQAARMFSWLSGCAILVFCIAIAEKVGTPGKTKGILLTLILTSTAFTDLLGDGKVDLTSSAAAIAVVYWLLDDDKKNWNLLAGFFAGLAMASRIYNVILLTVFIGSFYLLRIYFRRKDSEFHGLGSFARSMTWIVIGAIPPLSFHLLENWLVYHDAFAMLNSASALTADKWQWSFDPQDIWAMRLLYPLVVTFLNTEQSLGNISPLFLGFLPHIFFSAVRKKIRPPRALIEMTGAALITMLLWISLFFTVMEIRYVFFLWSVLFIAISQVIIAMLEDKSHMFHRTLHTLIIVLLGFSILRVIFISLDTYSPLDKQGNSQCSKYTSCSDYFQPINNNAKPGERVLSLLAFRYYLRADLFMCSTQMGEYDQLREASYTSSQKFWEEAYREGYAYVAYEKNYSIHHLYIDLIPDPNNTPAWMDLALIYENPGKDVSTYKINIIGEPPIPREKTCAQNNGIWLVNEISDAK